MIFTPRPWQTPMADFMLANPRGNIFASMGMGKTTTAVSTFETLRLFGEAQHALVIAPRRVALNTWPDEVVKWHESFGHLTIAAAIGTPDQRLAALRRNADITTINYDNLPWLMDVMGDHWHWDTVFADESTRLKGLRVTLRTSSKGKEFVAGQGSSRAKAIAKVAHRKVRRWYNLTGSPAPNGIVDLWGQMHFVDRGQRLGVSFTEFHNRWFRSFQTPSGYTQSEPMPHAQSEIERLIKDVSISIQASDWFDLKNVIERNVMVTLPPKARQAYAEMEDELFTQVMRQDVEAFNAGSKAQKCLQIANGAVYTDTKTKAWVEVHSAKIDALKSVIEEANGESVLVRYTHIPDRERILKAFPSARFLDNDPATQTLWNAGKIPMLVTHAASAGHGLNLQRGGRILCDFASDYGLEGDEQIIERIGPTRQMQAGIDRAVYRYRLVAKDTIEEHSVLPRLKLKMSVQDSLKAAVRMRA